LSKSHNGNQCLTDQPTEPSDATQIKPRRGQPQPRESRRLDASHDAVNPSLASLREINVSHLSSRESRRSLLVFDPPFTPPAAARPLRKSLQSPPLTGAAHHPPDARPDVASPRPTPRSCETLAADPPTGHPGDDAAPSSPRGQRAVPSSGGPRCSSPDPAPARPRASKL
jgi:hypothetical protein